MIILSEQHGGINGMATVKKDNSTAYQLLLSSLPKEGIQDYSRHQKENNRIFRIRRNPEDIEQLEASTSYYIGYGWILENEIAIRIDSKMDSADGEISIDIITMLNEALLDPKNIDHLDGLLEIRSDQSEIAIKQSDDLLTPFVLISFLHILRHIVKRGLKRDYYAVTHNLEGRIRGKILVTPTIQQHHGRGNYLNTNCQYDQFGIDIPENQLLKRALKVTQSLIKRYAFPQNTQMNEFMCYIMPAFNLVSDNANYQLINQPARPNRVYHEYDEALKLAKLILKQLAPQPNQNEQNYHKTPPYWIDMSKLYELYLFKKLRDLFKDKPNAVSYQHKAYYQNIDYLIDFQGDPPTQAIIDAKYKPYYKGQDLAKEDARQVRGMLA